jgi:TPR repeat protein
MQLRSIITALRAFVLGLALVIIPAIAANANPNANANAKQGDTGASSAASITPAQVDALIMSGKADAAFALAQRGAAQEDAELTGYVGWFYDNGRAVSADHGEAARWYKKAAEMGDAFARWRLGVMIDEGLAEGTLAEAVTLFRKAAGQKHSDALVSLAVMYATGRGVEADPVAAMRYYQAAALRGNAHGVQGLGVLFANGEGVEKDWTEAIAHWVVAAAAGNETADQLLAEHFAPLSEAEAHAAIERADQLAALYGVNIFVEVAGN